MTHLADLFDLGSLTEAIKMGFVRQQQHPVLPLDIFNYTERAQYAREWTPVTRQCRGLIVNRDNEVIARPFAKFFNYGEYPPGSHIRDHLTLSAPAEVTDKMDGSLGIMYPTGDFVAPYAIATRGSFTSEQALHGTDVLEQHYADFQPPEGWTCLFEIIYPANRIVCDYRGVDDLFLLGAVNIETGRMIGAHDYELDQWDGPKAELLPAATLGEALALKPRPGAEGVVVALAADRADLSTAMLVKIKQDDYVSLHKLVTGLNARAVWERLGAGESPRDICAALPDEFHAWVEEIATELLHRKWTILEAVWAEHDGILAELPEGWTRKDYALAAVPSPYTPWLFMVLDDRNPGPAIWKTLRPSAERTLVGHGEDVA